MTFTEFKGGRSALMLASGGHTVVEIAASQSLSDAIALEGRVPCAILIPGAWTPANITFQAATASNGTFLDVYDDAGSEYQVAAGSSRWILLAPVAFRSFAFLKLRSGAAAAPVVQAAARDLVLVTWVID